MFNLLGNEKSLPKKALTLGAIGMGVGFGTCGLGIMANDNRTDYLSWQEASPWRFRRSAST